MPAALHSHPPAKLAEFEQLMRRHNRTLFRTAGAILRDDAEAEDALQEGAAAGRNRPHPRRRR